MDDIPGLDIEDRAAAVKTAVPVLLPLALETTYDYLPPNDIPLAPGDFVLR
jgi:hypothetical protein